MHAKGPFRDAVLEFVQEGDAFGEVVNLDLHALVGDFRVVVELGGEGVVVGGEEADAADVGGDMV